MSKASGAYVTMFVLLIAGLWAIMHIGTRLQAPADLHGAWVVAWDDGGRAAPFNQLTIEQSGLFVDLIIDNGDALNGRFIREPAPDTHGPGNHLSGVARTRDGHWVISLRQSPDGAQLLGTMTSPEARAFTARKAARESPPAAGALPASQPASH